MTCQSKAEPLENLPFNTVQDLFNIYPTLYGMGYRGTLSTTASAARIDMTKANAITVSVGIGDVILYRAAGPTVVACVTAAEFVAGYDIIG